MGEMIDESVVLIGAPGSEMVGVIARSSEPVREMPLGVVIVVGGPQTRVGSHRQFVLLARALARAGYPCLRFDYTGMGDSPGPKPDFERAGPDIERACDALAAEVPGCGQFVLWGLCDGATASLLYAPSDERIAAVIAANPWARSEATQSVAIVRRHYASRLRAPDFWRKLLGGHVNVLAAAREGLTHVWRGLRTQLTCADRADTALPARLARTLTDPRRAVRLQLSGKDLTAAEFDLAMQASKVLERSPATALRLPEADHTFSDPVALRAVIDDSIATLRRISKRGVPGS